tara:strand:- start:5997 stop:6605 length:609 start_codon:yes stop_codon:yes gene_type:complete
MVSLTSIEEELRNYAKEHGLPLRKNGNLDMRKKSNKDAERMIYNRKILKLQMLLSEKDTINKELKTKINKLKKISNVSEDDDECIICSDKKIGIATLSCCGQEICISCFAKHSRVNNTCPFCRTEYAPKVKKPNKLCEVTLNAMADNWSNNIWNTGYFHRHLLINNNKSTPNESERHLEWIVRENGKILMKQVKNWYDAEFN